jgi:hypothetical protein
LSKQLAKIRHHALALLNPSCQLKFPVRGSRYIEDGAAAASILCDSLSVNFLIIGLTLSVLCLSKERKSDSAESYFRRAALRAAGSLAPNRFKDSGENE